MKLFELSQQNLFEGGNVFKTADGKPKTSRILLAQISPTLDWLEKVTGLPMHGMTLGSVGKKASSGDIDIVVDSNKISKKAFGQSLENWAIGQGLNPKDHVKIAGEVHLLTPIAGDAQNGFVQTDFFFHEDPSWMKFSMQSPGDASNYSGAERNQLMSSIAKALGLKYSWQRGLLNREDESVISKDPDTIAQTLLGPRFTASSFDSVESIQRAIKGNKRIEQGLQGLIHTLQSTDKLGPTGKPTMDVKTGKHKQKSPSDQRKDQEEAQRIIKLTGVSL
jgi:hypothetical protein